jgi:F-type H+-transporting ATPase subunit delta
MSAFSHPYAKAFLEMAPKGYDVEQFLSNAGELAKAITSDSPLKAFLATPAVPEDAKRKAVAALSARVGLDEFGARFLEVLLKNRRILETGVILKSLRESWDASRGVVEGRVTVAAPIGEAEKASLERALSERMGSSVKVKVDVDPKILAGFVAHVGSNVFDASARAGIRRFQEKAKGTGA